MSKEFLLKEKNWYYIKLRSNEWIKIIKNHDIVNIKCFSHF